MHESEIQAAAAHQPIDLQALVTVSPAAVAAPNESDCVVHNLETDVTYRLDAVGARIWEMLETGSTIAELVATVRAEYRLPDGIAAEQVASDAIQLISTLREYGLVIIDQGDPGVTP